MTKALVPSLLVLLLTLSAAAPALADDDSLHVIVLLPDKTMTVGEDTTVEVRVFDAGEPSAADSVSARALDDPFGGFGQEGTEVSLTEKSTGVFSGKTEVPDAIGNLGGLHVLADATKDDNSAMGS